MEAEKDEVAEPFALSLSAVVDIDEDGLTLQVGEDRNIRLLFTDCAREFARRVREFPNDYRDRMPILQEDAEEKTAFVARGSMAADSAVLIGDADALFEPPYLLFYRDDGTVRLEARQPHRPYDLFLPDPLERCRGDFEALRRVISRFGYDFYEI